MLELSNQLDGFDPRGNITVLVAIDRPDTLNPALVRPGRLDRKGEFNLPELIVNCSVPLSMLSETECFSFFLRSKTHLQDAHEIDELLARRCPNSTGAELRSVCTEAGMFTIRARRKITTKEDFIEALNEVIQAYAKVSSTPRYMPYNWTISVPVVFLNSFYFTQSSSQTNSTSPRTRSISVILDGRPESDDLRCRRRSTAWTNQVQPNGSTPRASRIPATSRFNGCKWTISPFLQVHRFLLQTTIVAVEFDGGVIIGADTRTSSG